MFAASIRSVRLAPTHTASQLNLGSQQQGICFMYYIYLNPQTVVISDRCKLLKLPKAAVCSTKLNVFQVNVYIMSTPGLSMLYDRTFTGWLLSTQDNTLDYYRNAGIKQELTSGLTCANPHRQVNNLTVVNAISVTRSSCKIVPAEMRPSRYARFNRLHDISLEI